MTILVPIGVERGSDFTQSWITQHAQAPSNHLSAPARCIRGDRSLVCLRAVFSSSIEISVSCARPGSSLAGNLCSMSRPALLRLLAEVLPNGSEGPALSGLWRRCWYFCPEMGVDRIGDLIGRGNSGTYFCFASHGRDLKRANEVSWTQLGHLLGGEPA